MTLFLWSLVWILILFAPELNSLSLGRRQRETEEVFCESNESGSHLLRNGLGDNSFYLWPDRRIPYIIDPTFNQSALDNIGEALRDFNDNFRGCIQWEPRADEVRTILDKKVTQEPWITVHPAHLNYKDPTIKDQLVLDNYHLQGLRITFSFMKDSLYFSERQ